MNNCKWIIVYKGVQKLKLSKNLNYKSSSQTWFDILNRTKQKDLSIFDIENWIFYSVFVTRPFQKLYWFPLNSMENGKMSIIFWLVILFYFNSTRLSLM